MGHSSGQKGTVLGSAHIWMILLKRGRQRLQLECLNHMSFSTVENLPKNISAESLTVFGKWIMGFFQQLLSLLASLYVTSSQLCLEGISYPGAMCVPIAICDKQCGNYGPERQLTLRVPTPLPCSHQQVRRHIRLRRESRSPGNYRRCRPSGPNGRNKMQGLM